MSEIGNTNVEDVASVEVALQAGRRLRAVAAAAVLLLTMLPIALVAPVAAEAASVDVLYRVNAGGAAVAAVDGGPDWVSDVDMDPAVVVAGGEKTSSSSVVAGSTVPSSTPGELFERQRWDPSWGEEMAWEFAVPTGTEVEVRVFLGDSYSRTSEPGERVFDLSVDGVLLAESLDLAAMFGYTVGGMVSTQLVSDGVIDVDFGHVVQNPLVNGFEIVVIDGPAVGPLTLNPIADVSVVEGESVVVPVSASGPDGIVLSTTGVPSFVSLTDNGDGSGSLALAPGVGDAGSYVDVTVVAEAGGESVSQSFTITVGEEAAAVDVLYRVNAGGPGVAAVDGGPDWTVDTVTTPSPWVNQGAGNAATYATQPGSVVAPVGYPASLFTTERYDTAGGNVMTWEFPVASGKSYDVSLMFSEKYHQTAGQRIFDVAIEGEVRLDDFDPSVPSGFKVGQVATFGALVADDYLTIEFARIVGDPTIDAIEITERASGADDAPVVSNIDDVTIDAGDSTSIAVSATDDQPLTLELDSAPSFVSLVDAGDGTGTITVAPLTGDAGSYPGVGLVATANGLSTTERFTITVNGAQTPSDILYRVNAGGPTLATIDAGPDWLGDSVISPPVLVAGGDQASNSSVQSGPTVPSSTPGALFSRERWDSPAGSEMAWEFPVAAGTQVELRMFVGDGYSGTSSPGTRIFDVTVDGSAFATALDLSGTYGYQVGAMVSTTLISDGMIDVDFVHDIQNPLVNGFEIVALDSPSDALGVSPSAIDFGNVLVGSDGTADIELTNLGQAGDNAISDIAVSIDSGPFVITTPPAVSLDPGASTTVGLRFEPTSASTYEAILTVTHSGTNSPNTVSLTGTGTSSLPIGFGSAGVPGINIASPTSLDFGPDGRLYVAQQNGLIQAFTVVRNGPSDYAITSTESIDLIQQIPNHNDDGTPAALGKRQVTGMMTAGTPGEPVLYVSSSDPRIAGGSNKGDSGLDTNSGVLSKLTWNGSAWELVHLVRGLPRSEENHSTNGMDLDPTTGVLYLQSGGFTNKGAPSNNFGGTPEYSLSSALLDIDLAAIEAMSTLVDDEGSAYKYDLPTLNDPTRTDVAGSQPADPLADPQDPWGGNNGLNQAILVEGGPVQVYAGGFRNAYDVVRAESGELYTWDNGPNSGWGGTPVGNGTAVCTNELNEGDSIGKPDGLHHITGAGYYGGHPNPTRGSADSGLIDYVKTSSGWTPAGVYDWSDFPVPPVPTSMIDVAECTYLSPASPSDNASLATVGASVNGITEYTASNFDGAMQGDILAAAFNGSIYRSQLTPDGTGLIENSPLLQGFGSVPLDVIALGDDGVFPGTIWAVTYGSSAVTVFEPNDFDGSGGPVCSGLDNETDEDGDGFTNSDELVAGTDPCSAGSQPKDADGDFVSDVTDPDDDNDGIDDTVDAFAVDATNGTGTTVGAACPTDFSDESVPSCLRMSAGQRPGTMLDLGFTGLMTNGTDYSSLYDPDNLIEGGAAGALAVQQTSAGSPFGAANSLEYGFQHGMVVPGEPFVVTSRVKAPFPAGIPASDQLVGIQIGDGSQSNFAALTVTGDGTDAMVSFATEAADTTTPVAAVGDNAMVGAVDIDLLFTIDPVAGTIVAEYRVGQDPAGFVGATTLSAPWLAPGSVLAVGVVASSGAAEPFTASWDFLDVEISGEPTPGATSAAFTVLSGSGKINASTYTNSSFRIENTSASGAQIVSVSYDLSSGWMSNMVFDPFGTAGDTTAKPFTPDSGVNEAGYQSFTYDLAHNGVDGDAGYDGLTASFNDFNTGETFAFSIDVDPTSTNGDPAPGTNDSASVSGLELSSATVTVVFSDGQELSSTLFSDGSNGGSAGSVVSDVAPAPPTIEFAGGVGESTSQSTVDLVVSGPEGATVHLAHVEAGLFLPTDLGTVDRELGDPLLANSVLSQTGSTITIGAGGTSTIPVTLRNTNEDAGINVLAAVIEEAGVLSTTSSVAVRYTP